MPGISQNLQKKTMISFKLLSNENKNYLLIAIQANLNYAKATSTTKF